MGDDTHIVASADRDAPEILEELELDMAIGAAIYGSSNSCEPTYRRPMGKWSDLDVVPPPETPDVFKAS